MSLQQQLLKTLYDAGAALVGVADMNGVPGCDYPFGVSVVLPLPKHVAEDLLTAPTAEYHAVYHEWNRRLNGIVLAGEAFLRSRGFRALAQTTDAVQVGEDLRSPLPHKTVATRAGLGWIGKNGLLLLPEFGGAVRISSLLTDAPLQAAEPVTASRCGDCRICVEACPAGALHGALWTAGLPREELVDARRCFDVQCAIMRHATGIDTDLCGKCFAVCPYTQRYLRAPLT